MPDLDGPAVCRAVRAEPGGAHIRLVLMTAADEGPLMPAAREAGADELVSKELSRHELLAVARGRPAAGQRRCA